MQAEAVPLSEVGDAGGILACVAHLHKVFIEKSQILSELR